VKFFGSPWRYQYFKNADLLEILKIGNRPILSGNLTYNHNIKESKCLAIAVVDPNRKNAKYKTILNVQTITTKVNLAICTCFWVAEITNCNLDIMKKIPRILRVNTKGNNTKAKRIEFV
jgi:hypothetical protein